MQSLFSNPSEMYVLQRLILVDSTSAGRIVEMPYEGGTVLTGKNGAGKTTMLQLVPLFYGESPGTIVSRSRNKLGFVDYYLPRATSYLVFEYRRGGSGVRCVVLHASADGAKVDYRFVRGEFSEEMFVEDTNALVQNANFARRLKHLDLPHLEKITSRSEYRSIILGHQKPGGDKQRRNEIRKYIADYSAAPIDHGVGLPNLEKIVQGMFKRKTNFEDFQAMVVDCIHQGKVKPSITGDRSKVEEWPLRYQAYQSVMAQSARMENVLQLEEELQTKTHTLKQLHAQYRVLLSHLEAGIQKCDVRALKANQAHHDAKSAYDTGRTARVQRITELDAKASAFEAQVRELDTAQREYAAQDVVSKSEHVDRAPVIQATLAQEQKHKLVLLGAQENIALEFQRLANDLQDSCRQQRVPMDASKDSLLLEMADSVDEVHRLFTGHYAALEKKFNSELEVLKPIDAELRQVVGQLSHAAKNPMADLDAVESSAKKVNAYNLVLAQASELKAAWQRVERPYYEAKGTCDQAAQGATAARRHLATRQEEMHATREMHTPDEKSLLHFLRSDAPDWTHDIAKVIRRDILKRTDLDPQFIERSASLYGVGLDLSKLDPDPHADIAGAHAAIEDAEKSVQLAMRNVELADERVVSCGAAFSVLSDQRDAYSHSAAAMESAQQSAKAEMVAAEQTRVESLARAKIMAENELAAAKERLAEHVAKAHQLDGVRAEALGAARTRRDKEVAAARRLGEARVDAVKQQIANLEAEKMAQLSIYARQKEQALEENGVNTVALRASETAIALCQQQLADVQRFTPIVQEWRHWLKSVWPARSTAQDSAVQFRTTHVKAKEALRETDADWKIVCTALASVLSEIKGESQKLESQHRTAKLMCEGALLHYPADESLLAQKYDPAWTLSSLALQSNALLDSVRILTNKVNDEITLLHNAFRSTDKTAPRMYFEEVRMRLSGTSQPREWIPHYALWFKERHRDDHDLLYNNAKMIAGGVTTFRSDMEKFHRDVQTFNRDLQRYLDTALSFDSITNLNVEVASKIKEQVYWGAIADMVEVHEGWLGGASDELPPPEFASTLQKLLAHWDMKNGIQSDLREMVRIQGSVVENGQRREFRQASDLEGISSNGLSYLILCSIFVAFINQLRRGANVNIVWALDELKDLDEGNVLRLMDLLTRNNITLVCAFPDPDPDTLAQFKNRFSVDPDRRLVETRLMVFDDGSDSVGEGALEMGTPAAGAEEQAGEDPAAEPGVAVETVCDKMEVNDV